jgi:polysaccharide pyruvyl transferase WcaK-like protein
VADRARSPAGTVLSAPSPGGGDNGPPLARDAVRILVEPSDYRLRNLGDMAMLRVGVRRLRALWPTAQIQVLSDTPDELRAFCPEATPLSTCGRRTWFDRPPFPESSRRRLPVRILRRLDGWLKAERPLLRARIARKAFRAWGEDGPELVRFLDAVIQADLLVVTGMGGIADCFPSFASELLDVVELAIALGRPTAMLGQGIGPLEDHRLRARARTVLPRVDLIALREERAGGPLLRSLGVPAAHVVTTGDDAIELSHERCPGALGNGLGVNLRCADYAAVDLAVADRVRPVLQGAARQRGVPLVALPLSRVPGEADAPSIERMIGSYADRAEGGEIDSPQRLIEKVRGCRVVVSGSYHPGVFALAMGIPVVGVAASAYYRDKFAGLESQFPGGCTLIRIEEAGFEERLAHAIDRAWDDAEHRRAGLLADAARQIEWSWAAYRRLLALLGRTPR